MRLFILALSLLLAVCTAQSPPPNRQLPILDPSKGIVVGVDTPTTTPRPIPPNRKRPVITNPGLVVGVRNAPITPDSHIPGVYSAKDAQLAILRHYLGDDAKLARSRPITRK
jgi:hypothetical protein